MMMRADSGDLSIIPVTTGSCSSVSAEPWDSRPSGGAGFASLSALASSGDSLSA